METNRTILRRQPQELTEKPAVALHYNHSHNLPSLLFCRAYVLQEFRRKKLLLHGQVFSIQHPVLGLLLVGFKKSLVLKIAIIKNKQTRKTIKKDNLHCKSFIWGETAVGLLIMRAKQQTRSTDFLTFLMLC